MCDCPMVSMILIKPSQCENTSVQCLVVSNNLSILVRGEYAYVSLDCLLRPRLQSL